MLKNNTIIKLKYIIISSKSFFDPIDLIAIHNLFLLLVVVYQCGHHIQFDTSSYQQTYHNQIPTISIRICVYSFQYHRQDD